MKQVLLGGESWHRGINQGIISFLQKVLRPTPLCVRPRGMASHAPCQHLEERRTVHNPCCWPFRHCWALPGRIALQPWIVPGFALVWRWAAGRPGASLSNHGAPTPPSSSCCCCCCWWGSCSRFWLAGVHKDYTQCMNRFWHRPVQMNIDFTISMHDNRLTITTECWRIKIISTATNIKYV